MELWELIRRMLEQATHVGELYSPEFIATKYHKHLCGQGHDEVPDLEELKNTAKQLQIRLLEVGLLKTGPRDTTPITLGARSLTEFGGELLSWLSRPRVVGLFESMMVDVDKGAIQQMLYQLDS